MTRMLHLTGFDQFWSKKRVCDVGILFLLSLDRIMRKATALKRRGIRWNFTTVLEDLDFTDEILLLSSKFNDSHKKTGRRKQPEWEQKT